VLTDLVAEGTSVILSSHRMDELAGLCSEVTILKHGRVIFSGPVSKLAAEADDLDYRVRTSDPVTAQRISAGTPGVRLLRGDDPLLINAATPALDELVTRLVRAGVAIRELAPVVAPLEAAFLALTESASGAREHSERRDSPDQHPGVAPDGRAGEIEKHQNEEMAAS
jgi:ABC-2 type transport system ATP-binding protein